MTAPNRKIWIAISTPFQVNFFYPIVKKLEGEFEFLITARRHDSIHPMLDALGLDYIPVGVHGGRELSDKLQAYAENIKRLIPLIKREKPCLLLTERWPAAVRVAFGFSIPAWTVYFDEREKYVNRMVFPLSDKVFAPTFYSKSQLQECGVDPSKIVWFKGFHTCYLKSYESKIEDEEWDLEPDFPNIIVRPEPEFASFFPERKRILEKTVSTLSSNGAGRDFNLVVIPRTKEQAIRYSKYNVQIPEKALPYNPVFHADVVLGAAETMLMEAFVLGKPSVSTIYWEESKPVSFLHRYIPHTLDPKEAAKATLEFLDEDVKRDFNKRVQSVVRSMDNPIDKIEMEIRRIFLNEDIPEKRRRRRSALEIYVDILNVVSLNRLKITEIMKKANLSYAQAKCKLEQLESRNLIRREIDKRGCEYFKATFEGLEILTDYKKIAEKLS